MSSVWGGKGMRKRWGWSSGVGSVVVFVVLGVLVVACRVRVPVEGLARVSEDVVSLLNETGIDRHIQRLASDEFEGRGVGTLGERKTVKYIAEDLRRSGFVGGAHPEMMGLDSFYQHVPFQGVTTFTSSEIFVRGLSGKHSMELQHGKHCALTTDLRSGEEVHVQEEDVIFGGYCINAPQSPFYWNDFKGVDVKGRVVLCLVNQPIVDKSFGGSEAPLTYYGRWTYKLEELRRLGAKGALIVHTDTSAGYGWSVVKSWGAAESVRLDPMSDEGTPLEVRGWVSSAVIDRMVDGGTAGLFSDADRRDFRAHAISLSIDVRLDLVRRFFTGVNVVGVLPSRNAARCSTDPTSEAVILTAHHDHFGIQQDGAQPGDDVIFNGALDNASGVAKLLEIARVFGELRRKGEGCDRKLVFIAPTAEEAVLLGSSFYATNPVASPLSKTIAMVNFDGMNIWGRTNDVVGIGSELSDIRHMLTVVAEDEQMVVSEDAEPQQGLFYRSDQLPFARLGVPAVKLCHGKEYIGRDEGYFNRVVGDYNNNRYHQVNDDYEYIRSHDDPYAGAMQEVRVAFRLLYSLANGHTRPEWNPSHPFAKARKELLDREQEL